MSYTYEDKRRWLTLQCRYYNGEAFVPSVIEKMGKGLFWDYERSWVEFNLNDSDMIKSLEKEAHHYNLTIAPTDKTPLTLKALLWDRHLHWADFVYSMDDELKSFERNMYTDYIKRETNKERRHRRRLKELVKKCIYYKGNEMCVFSQGSVEFFLWQCEKEWANCIADSYSNRERYFKKLMETPCMNTKPLSYWKKRAHSHGIPATLLACIIINYAKDYYGFKHEMELYFDMFIKDYEHMH